MILSAFAGKSQRETLFSVTFNQISEARIVMTGKVWKLFIHYYYYINKPN